MHQVIRKVIVARWPYSALQWLCIVIGLSAGSVVRAQAEPISQPGLIRQAGELMVVDPMDKVVMRRRAVEFDRAALSSVRAGDKISLELFDDVTVMLAIEDFRASGAQRFHWKARIENQQYSSVQMVLNGTALVGLIQIPDVGNFRIRTAGNLGLVIEQIDQSQFLPCGTTAEHIVGARNQPAGNLKPDAKHEGAASTPTPGGIAGPPKPDPKPKPEPLAGCLPIDVMVVYTPQARDAEGGTLAIEALAQLAIDMTNFAYLNSQVEHRVRLVHVAEVDYVESLSYTTDLYRLTDPNDGFMDEVHDLRAAHGADLVALLANSPTPSSCGVAWLMTNVSGSFEDQGFSVSDSGCTLGNLTFEHELGHNMGCHHDRATVLADPNTSPEGAYSFSYGHRFDGTNGVNYGTIMAYGINRVPYFSNPNTSYQGTPTGVAEGEKDAADNTTTKLLTAPTVADFRPSEDVFKLEIPWTAPARLAVKDILPNDHFGVSVAIDGDLAIVGAHTTATLGVNSGAAYIYRRMNNEWVQEAQLLGSLRAGGDQFGISVGILANGINGEVAVVGAPGADYGGFQNSGAAYVFRRVPVEAGGSGEWQEQAILAPFIGIAASDLFGWSVAITRAAQTELILVGAHFNDTNAINLGFLNNAGAAYIYRNTNGTLWTQEAKLVANDRAVNDQFGISVSVAGGEEENQAFAIVGAWGQDSAGDGAGAAYVFARNNNAWTQAHKFVPDDLAAGDQFGYSSRIALTEAGPQAIIGAWKANAQAGSAYVMQHDGAAWVQQAKLVAPETKGPHQFGNAVAIAGDVALVGAHLRDSESFINTGSAFVFRRGENNDWSVEGELFAPGGLQDDLFGYSVALQPQAAIIGTWSDDFYGNAAGSAFATRYIEPQDCNENNVLDICDILFGVSEDRNHNDIPDECEPVTCFGDLNVDGQVNVDDLLVLLGSWGHCIAQPCIADMAPPGGDGLINVDDLLILLAAWGPCEG